MKKIGFWALKYFEFFKLQDKKRGVQKFTCLFLFCIFFCFSSLCSMSKQEIETSVRETFDEETPGFETTLRSQNYGKWFELESALHAREFLQEDVIGFGLSINILNGTQIQRVPDLDGDNDFLELRNTEFDVVTKNHVFECKNSAKQKNFQQFIKEQTMLLFFNNLKRDMESENLDVFDLRRVENKKGIVNILTVNGLCTGGVNLSISCSWVNGFTKEICKIQWIEIIKVLSTKSLLVVFRKEVPFEIGLKLDEMGIKYIHNVGHFSDGVRHISDYDSGYEADISEVGSDASFSFYESDYSMVD